MDSCACATVSLSNGAVLEHDLRPARYTPTNDEAPQSTLSGLRRRQHGAEWLVWSYRVGLVPFGLGLVVAKLTLAK